MAMQRPHPRIIRIVLNDGIPRRVRVRRLPHQMGIPPRRIGRVLHRGPVIDSLALVDDEEVVAVEMHRVGCVGGVDVVVEDDADRWGLAEIVDVPLGVVGV